MAQGWRESLLEEGFRMYVPPRPGDIREPLLFCENVEEPERQQEPERPRDRAPSFRRLLSVARSEAVWIACGLVALLIRLPFTLAVPHYVSVALAAALAGDYKETMRGITFFCITGVVDSAGDFGNCIFFYYAQQRIVRRVRNDLMAAILRQEVAFFDTASTGELTSRLSSDCNQLSSDLTWVFRFTIEAVVRVVGVTAYLFWSQWQLGVIAVVLVPVFSFASKVYGKLMEDNATKVQTASAKANEVAQDAICSFRTVLSFAGEAFERRRYGECVQRSFALNMKQGLLQSVYYAVVNTFLTRVVLQGAFLYVGCALVLDGRMAASRLVAVMLYQGNLAESFSNLLNSAASLFKSSGSAAAVFALLDRTPAADRARSRGRPTPAGVVEFSGVHFAYPSRGVPVLRGISFRALPGTVTALVGPSGAGKSTVFHLLERFYEPERGSVLLDGTDVRELSHAWLHAVVGLVSQEPVLFRCSVGENIAYSRNCVQSAEEEERRASGAAAGARPPPDAQAALPPPGVSVEHAAAMANAHNFISAMPQGYATEIGERGIQLSGGQRQRIAIARAIYQDPRVLLLDEATSALDTESEALVQDALKRAMLNRTVLCIAHRLSTIAGADTILVLHGGRVVESGTHAELMARPLQQRGAEGGEGGAGPSYRALVEGDALARAASAATLAQAPLEWEEKIVEGSCVVGNEITDGG